MFSHEFSLEPLNLLPQNRCFVRGFRQVSAHLTKCHACHGICTLSPLDAALTMRLEKHATRHVWSAAPATQNDDGRVQSAAPATKTATHLSQKYCACHTKTTFATRYKTRLNVTKCHACHANRSNAICETSESDPFCRTYHRHGHTALADGCGRLRTVANGCKRLRTVGQRRANTPSTPRPPVKREPSLRIREKLQSLVEYVKRCSKHSNIVKTCKTFQNHSNMFKPVSSVSLSVASLIFPQLSPLVSVHLCSIPVVPHKAVAEVSKIGNLQERL